MVKTALITIWMGGNFPEWFPLWVRSASLNPEFDYYVVTDREWTWDISNIHYISMNLKEAESVFEKVIGMKICLKTPYKLCDYKPVWWAVIGEAINDYDYWGHIDTDVIYGNLSKFLTEDLLGDHTKIFEQGNLTIYKNTEEIRNIYKKSALKDNMAYSYKKAFRTNWACYFDEYMGMNLLGDKYFKVLRDQLTENYIQDFSWQHLNFTSYITKEDFIFKWDNGHLFRYIVDGEGRLKTDETGKLIVKEFLLCHIQKRRMEIVSELKDDFADITNISEFWIIPNKFTVKEPEGALYTEKDKVEYEELIRVKDKQRQIANMKRNGIFSYIPHRLRTKKIVGYIRKEKGFF